MQSVRTLGNPLLENEPDRKERANKAVYSGHLVLLATPEGSARTLLGNG